VIFPCLPPLSNYRASSYSTWQLGTFSDNHLSFFKMNAPHLRKLHKNRLSGIGQGATVFVVAFPIVNEPKRHNVDFQYF
jgi:hypothetical protein